MANPNPTPPPEHSRWKKGQSGNPNGVPKGSLNWSTIVKQILEDEDMFNAIIDSKKKPDWITKLNKKNGANAIAVAMMTKAVSGDEKAAKWLRETGWGNKLDITSDGETLFNGSKLTIEIVNDKTPTEPEATTSTKPA